MTSITLTVTGNSSSLNTYFHPEIELDERYDYSCCLLDLYTYNYIPNINDKNNKFYYAEEMNHEFQEIMIPVGSYELDGIIDYLYKMFAAKKIKCKFKVNKLAMKIDISCDIIIDFTRPDSIGSVFGFDKRILPKRIHQSDNIVNIQNVNNIRIDCDLTAGSYHNGKRTHTIYDFSPSVDPGYKINEQPKHLIYLPVIRRRINTLNFSIDDQDDELLDFRGEQITCKVHIKRDI